MTDGLDLGSLSDLISARAKQRKERRQTLLTLPVPGFEDVLAAQYRRLQFEERLEVAQAHDATEKPVTIEVSADLLLRACQSVLQVIGHDADGKPQYKVLGERWTSSLLGQLFKLDPVPENVRDAMMMAWDHDDIAAHFSAYMRAVNELDTDDVEALPGESVPSAEG